MEAIPMRMSFIIRDAITGKRQEIEINRGMTVREAVESSGFVASSPTFVLRDGTGWVVDDLPAADYANTVLTVGLPGDVVRGVDWTTIEEITAGFLALKVLGPFAQAFASKLGERLGESTAQAVSRIRSRRRSGREELGHNELTVSHLGTKITIVIADELTDDARLALIDLDVTAPGMRGATIQWNRESKTWRPDSGQDES